VAEPLPKVEGRQGRVIVGFSSMTPDDALDLADQIAEVAAVQGTMLGGMGPDDKGGWTVNMQPSPGLTRRMVDFLCEWLGPAENYTETRADLPFDLPDGTDAMELSPKPAGQVYPYVLTVRRAGGKSPHEKRIEAETERDQYREALDKIMRVTDPGDVRSRVGREAWELSTPGRRIAREALGLPIGGATDEEIDAKKAKRQ
jgi:hypothetical protein